METEKTYYTCRLCLETCEIYHSLFTEGLVNLIESLTSIKVSIIDHFKYVHYILIKLLLSKDRRRQKTAIHLLRKMLNRGIHGLQSTATNHRNRQNFAGKSRGRNGL